MSAAWPWLVLVLLGAYHGLNPAMGWLFAVSLGLQEGRREAVLKAFWPIALGHAAAVTLVVAAVLVAQVVIPLDTLGYIGAVTLIFFGLYKLIRRKHPRWVGMRVGFRDLTLWSFIMATAHGAGFMLVPVLLRFSGTVRGMGHPAHEHPGHGVHLFLTNPAALADIAAVAVHTLAMFAVMAAVALVVYEKLGLMILKRTWFNADLAWAGALIVAGVLTMTIRTTA
ncbi:hypothetical protein GBA63_08240 [Rubrobacter tropicus]|uniref:Uncharacterized protein n=1 Tax=Rubrobacter tropicus TaxID=2653851 RepID=A0A6G8Q872_9ACTN|nr:hypothetical protein [Rubrobacter tropicus]QIN82632.1 hypothetical protein GBA63_08240 [Rubrobacter tropicus]